MNESRIDRLNSIGTAFLEEDGTLRLDLRRNFETNLNFHKVLRIHPDNPRYRQYVEHIGGICFDEPKEIPAW
jgi:hypothetical protein